MTKAWMLLFLLLFTSCEWTEDEVLETGQTFDLEGRALTCKLDADRIRKILTDDIKNEITFLKESLHKFSDFVELEDEAVITCTELEKFIRRFYPSIYEDGRDSIRLIYDVSFLYFQDREESLSVKNIDGLISLVRILNNQGRQLNLLIQELTKENYRDDRTRLYSVVHSLKESLQVILSEKRPVGQSLVLEELLKRVSAVIFGGADLEWVERIKKLLFLKVLYLGGVEELLKDEEARRLVDIAPELVLAGFDLFYTFQDPPLVSGPAAFYMLSALRSLEKNIATASLDKVILDHGKLLALGDEFFREDLDLRNIELTMFKVKSEIIGGTPGDYTISNLKKILHMGQELFEQLYFNALTFSHFNEEMKTQGALPALSRPELVSYKVFTRHRLHEMWREFHFIVSEYRFFPDLNGVPRFGNFYDRQSAGVSRIHIARWALELAMRLYAGKDGDEWFFNRETLKSLILENEGLLVEMGLWRDDLDRFLTELTTGTDLFQVHANGDSQVSMMEASEYATVVMGAVRLNQWIYPELEKSCPSFVGPSGGKEGIEIACFRQEFLSLFFDQLALHSYFSKLYQYVYFNIREDVARFLLYVEEYSRIEFDDSIPLDQTDLTRILVSLSNIESIMVNYDHNRDNILSYQELLGAFNVFEPTITRVSNLKPNQKKLSKSIFYYFVKYMRPPKPLQLINFHVFGNKKKIVAKRMNIGAIFAFFAKQLRQ